MNHGAVKVYLNKEANEAVKFLKSKHITISQDVGKLIVQLAREAGWDERKVELEE